MADRPNKERKGWRERIFPCFRKKKRPTKSIPVPVCEDTCFHKLTDVQPFWSSQRDYESSELEAVYLKPFTNYTPNDSFVHTSQENQNQIQEEATIPKLPQIKPSYRHEGIASSRQYRNNKTLDKSNYSQSYQDVEINPLFQKVALNCCTNTGYSRYFGEDGGETVSSEALDAILKEMEEDDSSSSHDSNPKTESAQDVDADMVEGEDFFVPLLFDNTILTLEKEDDHKSAPKISFKLSTIGDVPDVEHKLTEAEGDV